MKSYYFMSNKFSISFLRFAFGQANAQMKIRSRDGLAYLYTWRLVYCVKTIIGNNCGFTGGNRAVRLFLFGVN
jgi:hypothetical protein